MSIRIAVVQHGDFLTARDRLRAGEEEWYFGVRHAIDALEELLCNVPHLVISLDAPSNDRSEGQGRYLCMPRPETPAYLPATLTFEWWARRIVRKLRQYEPTHVLLRAQGIIGLRVSEYCVKNNLNTLAVFAASVQDPVPRNLEVNRKTLHILNAPCVWRVGNYKKVATQGMVDLGLEPAKTFSWDWPGGREPKDFPVKELPQDGPLHIVYIGSMRLSKGVGDLIDAVGILRNTGLPVIATIAGDGPDMQTLRDRAACVGESAIHILGQIPNQQAFDLMLASTLVCVPSRHEFAEGMPLALTEGLASRSPIIASDHPMFVGTFKSGEGVRIFRASAPASLAEAVKEVVADPDTYRRYSAQTLDAFQRTECQYAFQDIIRMWKATF